MEKLKEAYEALNTNATIELQQSDSSTGVKDALSGTSDIGMASRELKESEVSEGAVGKVIAIDGIAVVVNNENPISSRRDHRLERSFQISSECLHPKRPLFGCFFEKNRKAVHLNIGSNYEKVQ